jgi:hypothetical protein
MLRVTVLAVLLSGTSEVDQLVADLGDDNVQIRDRAVSELLRRGREARAALEGARSSQDLEVRARARDILNRTSPLQILFEFDPERADANETLNLSLRLINESNEEAVFFSYGISTRIVLLQLFEAPREGTIVFDGCSIRRTGCRLSEDDFVRVAPGCGFRRSHRPIHTREADVGPEIRSRFPNIHFWKAELAGSYKVVASYRFDRAAYKSRCAKGCPDHDDPRKLWNRCSSYPTESERFFTIAVGVERCACERH